jgi:Tfp pilus assembly protein PilX
MRKSSNQMTLLPSKGSTKGKQAGAALVLTMVVLAILSVLIAGLGRQVRTDLMISRNIRLKNDAFNWAEAGLHTAEEMIAYAVDTRGLDANASFSQTLAGANYTLVNPGASLFANSTDDRTVTLSGSGQQLSQVQVNFLSRRLVEGGSIIANAGYEGPGKGPPQIIQMYRLQSEGMSREGNGRQHVAETYRLVGGGR